MSRYDDIIDLPHHVSEVMRPMPLQNRAAQFAPFAALTGHEAAINETARLTSTKTELSDCEKTILDRRLSYAVSHLSCRLPLDFTVFVPDRWKTGGSYVNITGIIKKLDTIGRLIILEDGRHLRLDCITGIGSPIFDTLDQ